MKEAYLMNFLIPSRLTFGIPPSFTSSLPASRFSSVGRQNATNSVAIVLIPAVPMKTSIVTPINSPSVSNSSGAISIGSRMIKAP